MSSYFRFLLLSFSLTWPALYGGLAMMTLMGALRCRWTRSVLASLKNVEFALLLLGRFKRVHETDALERLVAAGGLPEGVLDVHRGDVIGQEHHFVAVQFLAVLVRQCGSWESAASG